MEAGDSPPALSVYIVLGLGTFLGGVVRGLSGFGSAIAITSVWALASAFGVDAGSLHQSVATDCLSSVAAIIPLLLVTEPWKTSSLPLTLTLGGFSLVGLPLGAALLVHFNQHLVELAMSLALLLLIAVRVNVCALLCSLFRRSTSGRQPHSPAHSESAEGEDETMGLLAPTQELAVLENVGDAGGVRGTESQGLWGHVSATLALEESSTGVRKTERQGVWDHAGAAMPLEDSRTGVPGTGREDVPDDACTEQSYEQELSFKDQFSYKERSYHQSSTLKDRLAALVQITTRHMCKREFLHVLGGGTIAGACSGIMAGLTGMGGPPLMLLYQIMDIPKETVRGTNAWLNFTSIGRLLSYYSLALFTQPAIPLYAASCCLNVVGLLIGHHFSAKVNQKAFGHMLTSLMCVSSALLLAAAAGATG
eukprot:gene1633-33024_t